MANIKMDLGELVFPSGERADGVMFSKSETGRSSESSFTLILIMRERTRVDTHGWRASNECGILAKTKFFNLSKTK